MGAIAELISVALSFATSLTIITGALAPADYGVLETAELNRIALGRTERSLSGLAGPRVVRIGVEDCRLIGRDGWLIVEGFGVLEARVVDCQQEGHTPLSELGILADVNLYWLGHKRAVLILWQ